MDGQQGSEREAPKREDGGFLKDHYATLNVAKNASPKEIHEAFHRLKNTYTYNNQALYSLIDDDDIHASLTDVTEAYQVLCREDARLAYDHKLLDAKLVTLQDLYQELHEQAMMMAASPTISPIWPQAGGSSSGANPLAAGLNQELTPVPLEEAPQGPEGIKSLGRAGGESAHYHAVVSSFFRAPSPSPLNSPKKLVAARALEQEVQNEVARLIAEGDPGDGKLYQLIRQTVGVSKEEMQEQIKISIGYIEQLEQNRFDLLPQPVYVKGFLKSYLRFLGVSGCDRLVAAYAERLNTWVASQSS